MKTTMRLGIIESLHLFQHPCFGYFWPDLAGTTNVSSLTLIVLHSSLFLPTPFYGSVSSAFPPTLFYDSVSSALSFVWLSQLLKKNVKLMIFTHLLHIHVSRINQYQNCILTPLADLQNLGKQINLHKLKILSNRHHGCEQNLVR